MTANCLLDTNILVYAVDSGLENRAKRDHCLELIASEDFGLSAQVLQEFYVTVTRKLKVPMSGSEALAFIDRFSVFPCVASDQNLVVEGIRNSLKFQTSYWDGAIIAAAERLRAKVLFSEDLNHGQIYGSVRVVNPFLE